MSFLIKSKSLPQIFESVSKLESVDEKVSALKFYNNTSMRWLVDLIYNRSSKDYWFPEYKKNTKPYGICDTNLQIAMTRLESAIRFFELGRFDKYDSLMTLVLEGLSEDEAQLIQSSMVGKKISGISKSVWKKVYPELLTSETEEE